MIRLLLVADDFTGALDSSIFFASKGVSTVVEFSPDFSWEDLTPDAEILAVNSASRHMPAQQAAAYVRRIVSEAKRRNVGIIFKKVDSALRGNPGSELAAVLDAPDRQQLFLLPAYPTGGRITRHGMQLWNGKPISETTYRNDPFEPVLESNIKRILQQQTSIPISEVPQDAALPSEPGIFVLDADTNEQILQRCSEILRRPEPVFLGGCAGLSAALAHALYPAVRRFTTPIPKLPLIIVSGSLHPVSIAQMAFGRNLGLPYHALSVDRELSPEFPDTPAGAQWLQAMRKELATKRVLLLETAGTGSFSRSPYDAVSRRIAALLARVYSPAAPAALAVFGGDTLLEVAAELLSGGLLPQYEVEPGVPLALATDKYGYMIPLISKSGGFGTEHVIETLIKTMM